MSGAVLWFRRDLRLGDHPALLAAAGDGPVVALFVLDDALRLPSGAPRIALLYRTLRALDAQLREHGGALTVRRGLLENVVPAVRPLPAVPRRCTSARTSGRIWRRPRRAGRRGPRRRPAGPHQLRRTRRRRPG